MFTLFSDFKYNNITTNVLKNFEKNEKLFTKHLVKRKKKVIHNNNVNIVGGSKRKKEITLFTSWRIH